MNVAKTDISDWEATVQYLSGSTELMIAPDNEIDSLKLTSAQYGILLKYYEICSGVHLGSPSVAFLRVFLSYCHLCRNLRSTSICTGLAFPNLGSNGAPIFLTGLRVIKVDIQRGLAPIVDARN